MKLDFRLEQRLDAPLDRAWEACATARGLERWQADVVKGEVAQGNDLDLSWPALGTSLSVSVSTLVEREEIAFDSGGSVVRLLLAPGRVVLEHQGLEPGDDVEGVASSWRLSLALLAHSLAAHPGAERQALWMLDNARTTAEAAHAFFSDPAALGTWLGSGGGVGSPGSRVAVACAWGGRIEGTVLANTPGRDVAMSWQEDGDSVLCLRTLPSPRSDDDRLLLVHWSRWSAEEPSGERRRGLETALRRLARNLARSPDA